MAGPFLRLLGFPRCGPLGGGGRVVLPLFAGENASSWGIPITTPSTLCQGTPDLLRPPREKTQSPGPPRLGWKEWGGEA